MRRNKKVYAKYTSALTGGAWIFDRKTEKPINWLTFKNIKKTYGNIHIKFPKL